MRCLLTCSMIVGLGLIGCKPGDQQASSRGQSNGVSRADGNVDTSDDPLVERQADFSVPVSGTNLIFGVSPGVKASSVDAYVVGYLDTIRLTKLSETQFALNGVPAGAQEVIITGQNLDESTKLGIRLPFQVATPESIDLGTVELPQVGSLEGQVEMDGVAAFSTLKLAFPGTRIVATVPDAIGHYTMQDLPVGNHSVSWMQKDNKQNLNEKVSIVAAIKNLRKTRELVRSIPNSPSNLKTQSYSSGVALSWISGGGSASGYLVYRGQPGDAFAPESGKSYSLGKIGDGTIISNGSQLAVKDLNLPPGTPWTYKVYAYNQDLAYSAPRSGTITVSETMAAYQRYRLYIDSVANNCQSQGTAQIQALNFYIDKVWQINDFTSNTNNGRIGPYPVTVSVNNMYNNAYDAFFAFQDDNLAWSSSFKSYSPSAPYDYLSNKNPDGIYFEMNFGSTAVSIEGLEILGGEPPFYPECSPDSWRLLGSNDGTTWTAIPGAAHQENTEMRLRYYFQKENRPLSPMRFRTLSNEGVVQLSWESASGTEVGYTLVRSRRPEPFVPEAGRVYILGTQENGFEIVVDGNLLSYVDSSFPELHTPYYYTLLSYDASRQYAPAIIGRATPEKRVAYRYYRFVVNSILGGGPTSTWVDNLKIQVDGVWIDSYSFNGMQGTIGSWPVTLSESSASGTNHAYGIFGAGYWQTAKGTFNAGGMADAVKASGEYVQMDFGDQPLAITGYRAFGNNTTDNGHYSSSMYYQVPDLVHLEYSQDGERWTIVDGSICWYSLALETEMVW